MKTTSKFEVASNFLSKAQRMLRWAQTAELEMREYAEQGDMDGVERSFSTLLAWFSSIHEALEAAAGTLGEQEVQQELQRLRKSDPLLLYMWKARDLHIHDSLFKWDTNSFQLSMLNVDTDRLAQFNGPDGHVDVNALFRHLYDVRSAEEQFEKMAGGHRPTAEAQELAGVRLSGFAQSLVLDDVAVRIAGKRKTIPAPIQHLGQPLTPSANSATSAMLAFYQARASALQLVNERKAQRNGVNAA